MISEDLRTQCQQAFEQLKRIHRRATVRLEREREQLEPDVFEFDWSEQPRPMIAIDGSYRELWHDNLTDSGLYLFRAAATTYVFYSPQDLKRNKEHYHLQVQVIDVLTQEDLLCS